MNESTAHENERQTHGAVRYLRPGRLDAALGRLIGGLARAGFGPFGARVLAVHGRTSGQLRTVVVNVLTVDGRRYLVAPRGHAHWVRNLRAAGGGELRLGRRSAAFTVTELSDTEKPPVIRAYLTRWGWEVGRFFDGLTKRATDDEILAVASGFPVFRVD